MTVAFKRLGHFLRHRDSGFRRLGGLALVSLPLLALPGCGAHDRVPTGPGTASPTPGGRGTRTGDSQLLIGTWENIQLIAVVGDIVRVTTTWEFRADATCRHTTVRLSLAEGVPLTQARDCSYLLPGSVVRVTYDGAPESIDFDFSLANFSPDRLVLDGFEFERLR